MRIDLDRRDIHAGDHVRPRTIDVDEDGLLSELLRTALLDYVPPISTEWIFRAKLTDGWTDVAVSGARNADPRLLIPDASLGSLFANEAVIAARPRE